MSLPVECKPMIRVSTSSAQDIKREMAYYDASKPQFHRPPPGGSKDELTVVLPATYLAFTKPSTTGKHCKSCYCLTTTEEDSKKATIPQSQHDSLVSAFCGCFFAVGFKSLIYLCVVCDSFDHGIAALIYLLVVGLTFAIPLIMHGYIWSIVPRLVDVETIREPVKSTSDIEGGSTVAKAP